MPLSVLLTGKRLKSDVQVNCGGNGSGFIGKFRQILDRRRVKSENISSGVCALKAVVERAFSMQSVTQQAARKAHVLLFDAENPRRLDPL